MSNSNQVRVSYQKKATDGAPTPADLQTINMSSESFVGNKQTSESDIIQASGNSKGLLVEDFTSSGGYNSNFGFDWHNDMLESALRSAFQAQVTVTDTTISFVAGVPVTLGDSASNLASFEIGDIIWVAGATNAVNNGAFFVSAVTAGALDVTPVDFRNVVVNEGAGASITISCTRMTNANTPSFYDFERFYEDKLVRHAFLDQQLDTANLTFAAGGTIGVDFGFTGGEHTLPIATIGNGTYLDAASGKVLDMKNHYLGTLIGNNGNLVAPPGACVTSIALSITNAIRATRGNNCITYGMGKFTLKSNISMMFEDNTHYREYVEHGDVAMAFALADSDGNGYGFYLPRIQYETGDANASGQDADVPLNLNGHASENGIGYTLKICKLGQ